MIFLRSTIFNFAFYGLTAVACVLCLPGLFLPREKALYIVYFFVHSVHILEKYILGLDFEVRGRENLPTEGAFIVAAKHQSPYETLKLHVLFKDPAIVLKKELLDIPLWGRFLAKTEPIAIDRSQKKEAMAQITDRVWQIKLEKRPIVIFPQGTRVHTWESAEDKPYRSGFARVYSETGIPIVPLALNTGMFWPRRSWIKQGGRAVFEFLPRIEPGFDSRTVAEQVERTIEDATQKLHREALTRFPQLHEPRRPERKANS